MASAAAPLATAEAPASPAAGEAAAVLAPPGPSGSAPPEADAQPQPAPEDGEGDAEQGLAAAASPDESQPQLVASNASGAEDSSGTHDATTSANAATASRSAASDTPNGAPQEAATTPPVSASSSSPRPLLSDGVAPYAAGPTRPFVPSPPRPAAASPEPRLPPPSVHKRRMPASGPRGILKPAPPPAKTFSFRRDILQSLNSRLAQGGVNMQVPVPAAGGLQATAQGTAQAAGQLIGGVFKRLGGLAAGVAAPGMGLEGDGSSRLGGISSGAGAPLSRSMTSSSTASTDSSATLVPSSPVATNTLPAPASSSRPLRRVQFRVSSMRITYPISGAIAPGDEDATRIRVEREHRASLKERRERAWTVEELERLYRECCRTREEFPLKKMREVFQEAAQASPPGLRTMDLSFVPLDRPAIEPISDLLSIDFGLQKLVLENCGLTDEGLKSILHGLLISGSLPNLSLASNRKLKYNAWRYVGIFMRRARALRSLDLSENTINKASLEHIMGAIAQPQGSGAGDAQKQQNASASASGKGKAQGLADVESATEEYDSDGEPLMPMAQLLHESRSSDSKADGQARAGPTEELSSSVISLRLENCGLKTASLEMLSQAVRFSELRHISLRRNRIAQLGAVALAIMLKDYPDSRPAAPQAEQQWQPHQQRTGASAQSRSASYSDGLSGSNGMPYAVRQGSSAGPSAYAVRSPPGSRSASLDAQGSRGRAAESGNVIAAERSYSPALPDVPMMVSSAGGGVTNRRMPNSYEGTNGARAPILSPAQELERTLSDHERAEVCAAAHPSQTEEEAISLYQAKRARRILADLPRVGNLLTLDLKGNDVRGGVAYLAQALKKNRTLRVLNLSDNNIDMGGLIAVAEALKYNTTLETLDMSHNPCSGPGLEGISTLRMAFALNTQLKRLFLNDTDLSSEGAISLAEFLPDSKLLHLDLVQNYVDIAGVMALAAAVKLNKSIRCLDIEIPPNDPDFARLSRDIMMACVTNTERAQSKAASRGIKIAAPIHKSVVARTLEEERRRAEAAQLKAQQAARARARSEQLSGRALVEAGQECVRVLRELLAAEEQLRQQQSGAGGATQEPTSREVLGDVLAQAKMLRQQLARAASDAGDETVGSLVTLNDELEAVAQKLHALYRARTTPRLELPAGPQRPASADGAREGPASAEHLSTPVIDSALSSPTFSIGSDEDDDADGLQSPPSLSAATSGFAEGASKDAAQGLRIDLEPQTAARDETALEEPDQADESLTGAGSPATKGKAKGQLSEEGELFRRAVALHIDDDEGEEDDAEKATVDSKTDGAGSAGEPHALSAGLAPRRRRGSASSGTSSDAARPELPESGEELRAQLLEVDVPRSRPTSDSPTRSKSDDDTDAEESAAAAAAP